MLMPCVHWSDLHGCGFRSPVSVWSKSSTEHEQPPPCGVDVKRILSLNGVDSCIFRIAHVRNRGAADYSG